jgi:hypothetical protein
MVHQVQAFNLLINLMFIFTTHIKLVVSFPLRTSTIGVKHGHIPPSHCKIQYIQMFVLTMIGIPSKRKCQHLWHEPHGYICKILE